MRARSSTQRSNKKEEASPLSSHPFEPIIDETSKILILGTFPSLKSFENSFYYGHPRNQFWKLLAAVLDEKEPETVQEKIAFLKKHHIALWDMVKACHRAGSLDSALKNVEVNDIAALLEKYPNIKALFFTGRKAQELFERNFGFLGTLRYYLPSPSPAYRQLTFKEKVKKWSILTPFLR